MRANIRRLLLACLVFLAIAWIYPKDFGYLIALVTATAYAGIVLVIRVSDLLPILLEILGIAFGFFILGTILISSTFVIRDGDGYVLLMYSYLPGWFVGSFIGWGFSVAVVEFWRYRRRTRFA